jgi:hypothetical protein
MGVQVIFAAAITQDLHRHAKQILDELSLETAVLPEMPVVPENSAYPWEDSVSV